MGGYLYLEALNRKRRWQRCPPIILPSLFVSVVAYAHCFATRGSIRPSFFNSKTPNHFKLFANVQKFSIFDFRSTSLAS